MDIIRWSPFVLILLIASPINCIAGDPRSTGDLVGRALGYPIIGGFGHVGMWTGSRVLQVVGNNPPVIRQNTLAEFKNGRYWGARYGKGNNFYTMISKGWEQSYFKPSYTRTALWREGKWEYKCTRYGVRGICLKHGWVMTTAKFRCDTFVNYMYKKGTGKNLVNWYITPHHIYTAMPKVR